MKPISHNYGAGISPDTWPSNPAVDQSLIYDQITGFPPGLENYRENGFIPPETTYFPRDADFRHRGWFARVQKIDQGFGKLDTPLDERSNGLRVDPERWSTLCAVEVILSKVEPWMRDPVRERVKSTSIMGFNRHYGGVYGCTLGGLLYEHCKGHDASCWVYRVVSEVCEGLGIDVEALHDYAVRVWGDGE